MSSLPKNHKVTDHKDVVGQVMHRWKHKDPRPLHSGKGKKGKEGKIVKSKDQAIAITLSIANKGGSGYSERLMSLGFSQEAAERASVLLEGNTANQFLTGRRTNTFDREDKTTEAKGLTTHDIDSRSGIQTGSQGKQKNRSSQTISPLSVSSSNPDTNPPSRNDRKGYSMFEETKCPKPRKKKASQLPKPETSKPPSSENRVTSATPSKPEKPKDMAAEAEKVRKREACKNKGAGEGAGQGVSFKEPSQETSKETPKDCPKPRTSQQNQASQQAAQQSQQQGKSFDQLPQNKVSELGKQGGEAPRKKKNPNCP